MTDVTSTQQALLSEAWRQRLSSFGLTVLATVTGGLLLAGILWAVGALNQVNHLTTKVVLLEDNMNRGLDELKTSIAALADDTTLKNIEDDVKTLRQDLNGFMTSEKDWQQEVELRLTNLEDPVGGAADDDTLNSNNPDHYLPELKRGSR